MAKLNRRIRPTMRAFRDKYGLGQREVAATLGISRMHISHVETGIRTLSEPLQTLLRIFDAYPEVFRDRLAELDIELPAPGQSTGRRRRTRHARTQDNPA